MSRDARTAIARRLLEAETSLKPIAPFAHELGCGRIDVAYDVQRSNVAHWRAHGRRQVGRKIGLTSKAAQQQLGVDEPDYGKLFSDMEMSHGESIERSKLIAPRVEAEIAFVLARDVTRPDVTIAQLMQSIAFAVPALEVVDSRIRDWNITIVDTIADNGASSKYVLGLEPRRIVDLDLENCGMTLRRNGEIVSIGTGSACLGHPLKAAQWLARILVRHGAPLLAGDTILTGALGPMIEARAGDLFEGRIGQLPEVRVHFRRSALGFGRDCSLGGRDEKSMCFGPAASRPAAAEPPQRSGASAAMPKTSLRAVSFRQPPPHIEPVELRACGQFCGPLHRTALAFSMRLEEVANWT